MEVSGNLGKIYKLKEWQPCLMNEAQLKFLLQNL